MGKKWRYEVKLENGRREQVEVEELNKGTFFPEVVYKVYIVKSEPFWSSRKEGGEINKLSELKGLMEAVFMSDIKEIKIRS